MKESAVKNPFILTALFCIKIIF
ncbi:hypothetical protein CGSHi22121_01287 [Haemophilus influenzae 22.1-21]|nr:hypothetical protein CGSHiEE_08805 [Haemophilus influenzae PittEE]EDJ87922.1 hypothetical protein CGSHi22121_01287 [Haemophilus influenzae 22.1-21]EDK08755.1 hypothetical protein CGSHiHH_04982 [Haemophilus influenzae PittHH]